MQLRTRPQNELQFVKAAMDSTMSFNQDFVEFVLFIKQ